MKRCCQLYQLKSLETFSVSNHPEISVLSRDLVLILQLTLNELVNAKLIRAELIFEKLIFADFFQIRKN